jgi:hypothetical protein
MLRAVQRAWIAVIVVVGIALGVAIAGIPNRHHDAPLRISTTSTTTVPGS